MGNPSRPGGAETPLVRRGGRSGGRRGHAPRHPGPVEQHRGDGGDQRGPTAIEATGGFSQDLPADDGQEDDDQAFWAHYWDCDPCSYPDRSGDLRSVTKISDFYSARQWHGTGMYRDHFRGQVEHEMMVCLPAGPGRSVRLIFFRGAGADFTERDRGLLALLRPHLHEAYRVAERRRRGDTLELTPRQRELLHLVADGYTNAQIGRRLGLSEATVRKHLENIFARLRVTNRTAAVIKAFPDQVA